MAGNTQDSTNLEVIPINGKANIKVKLKKLSGLETPCTSAYYARWEGQLS